MFAIIHTGGKQYRVQKDQKLRVEKIDAKEGDKVTLDSVLYVGGEKSPKVGTPFVKGAKVEAKVVEQTRAPKITVFKKKRRKNYRRTLGHRQPVTVLEITDIKAA